MPSNRACIYLITVLFSTLNIQETGTMYFTIDLFIDALILLLHIKNEQVVRLVTAIIEIYEKETKDSTYMSNDTFSFYIFLIKEVMQRNISVNDQAEIEAFLLKFKSNQLMKKDPEMYSSLRKIFTDQSTINADRYAYLVKRLSNCLLWYQNIKVVKKMFAKMSNNSSPDISLDQQNNILNEISSLCENVIKLNQDRNTMLESQDEHQARFVDFDDKSTLFKAFKVYEDTSVRNVFKTGWQALNRAFGAKGGFILGNSIVFNALSHNGKSLMLLNFARWCVTLNKVSHDFKNPTCILYSLENETPQNLMQLFKAMYCNLKGVPPSPDMTQEQIIDFCYETFRINGWKLIIDRRLGTEFGFAELVRNFEEYIAQGYTPLMCIIDYMNIMKKGASKDGSKDGNYLFLRELYSNVCNYLKSKNCTLVTAHQLNRKAAEAVRQNPIGAVKRFTIDMLADGMDPQREVDCAFYIHKEMNQHGDSYLTCKIDKHRYDDTTPEKDKYFAYRFIDQIGIPDDLNGPDMSIQNIYADKYHGDDAEDATESTISTGLFG